MLLLGRGVQSFPVFPKWSKNGGNVVYPGVWVGAGSAVIVCCFAAYYEKNISDQKSRIAPLIDTNCFLLDR